MKNNDKILQQSVKKIVVENNMKETIIEYY